MDRARPLRAGRRTGLTRPAPRQDRISVPVKIGNPIGSDSAAYLALTAADGYAPSESNADDFRGNVLELRRNGIYENSFSGTVRHRLAVSSDR